MAHKISKILLPIDGSEYSMRAVDYAIVEAKKEVDVELFAIHVVFVRQDYSLNFLAELGGGHVHTRIPEKIEKEIQGWFDIIKEKTDQNKLELRTDIVVGSKPVAWVVVDYAKVQNVDLIIIGSKGRSGFKKLLLGSVASGVITHSHCPVTVVK